MKAGVVTFPGSNCDEDVIFSLSQFGFTVEKLWHKDRPSLQDFQLIVLPGGFSYGDYLRCGAMSSLSPVMESVTEFANGGKLVLGICNGFQILCESRLLPGALARNQSQKFVCEEVSLKVTNNQTAFSKNFKANEIVSFPIAHGEGRFVIDADGLTELKNNNRIVLSYAGKNPNGSQDSIAGITNEKGNVFGLMPHPERSTHLRSQDGKKFWQSIVSSLSEKV